MHVPTSSNGLETRAWKILMSSCVEVISLKGAAISPIQIQPRCSLEVTAPLLRILPVSNLLLYKFEPFKFKNLYTVYIGYKSCQFLQ